MQSLKFGSALEKKCVSLRPATTRRVRLDVVAARRPRTLRQPLSQPHRAPPLQYAQSPVESPRQRVETVGEVMTAGRIFTVFPDTPVLEALELVVEKRITGLPVVNRDNKVVGVVSDFDLLAIDLKEEARRANSIFPSLDQSWEVFHDLQNMVAKSEGRIVEDVMTNDPIVVRAETSIHSASRLLLETKMRRLPVVDSEGSLIGLLTRRDIVTAALAARREHPEYFTDQGNLFPSLS